MFDIKVHYRRPNVPHRGKNNVIKCNASNPLIVDHRFKTSLPRRICLRSVEYVNCVEANNFF